MERNYKFVKILFVVISLAILSLGFLIPEHNSLTILIGLLAFIGLMIFDIFTPQIAGLSKDNPKVKTMRRLNRAAMVLIILFFGIFEWVPSARDFIMKNEEITGMLIAAAIMIVIGNAAPKLPFNRYMGLRLPWTVRDEVSWRAAHKLMGYITFPLVIVLAIGSIFGNPEEFIKYCVLTWVIIPSVYSGWIYYQRMKGMK